MVSPAGDVIAEAPSEEETALVCEIDLSEIARVRKKIPYLKEYDCALLPGGQNVLS